jgi:predicted Zn-dependent peptidase
VGGSLNAFTSEEYTCFLAKIASKHFESVFDVLSDMVLGASITETDLEKERTVIMEEVKMTQDQPSQLVDEILSEIVWPNHALGRPLAGTLKSVAGLSRSDIVGYRDRYYQPNCVTIVAAGDVDQTKLVRAAEKNFIGPKIAGAPPMDLFQVRQEKPAVKIFKKSTEQTHLSLALHAFSKNHRDEYVLDILNVILGGNMSSRLFNEVREERGLAYDVSSFVRRYHETGAFVISAGVDNQKALQALEVILKELEKISKEPVPAQELRRAKDFYLGQLDLGLENSMNHMLWVGENIVTLDKHRTSGEITERVEQVGPEDLQRVAQNLFKTNSLNLAMVGLIESEKQFHDVLHLSTG